jgi:hypothetical protein
MRGLASTFPSASFMAAELTVNALDGIYGNVMYPVTFGL